jgi:choline dehydrogenase-like flavoprotein
MSGGITEGHQLKADQTLQCDVCVIGTGCGGATLGCTLAEAGKHVIFLEQGGYYTRADFDQREVHMLAKIDGSRGLDASANLSASLTYGNNVGGASVHYWADSYRTPADRLKVWEDEHGLTGHGLTDLNPHFEELENALGVHLADDIYVNRMNALFRDAATALGWQVHKVPQARQNCARSGYCMQGCAYDAKQSQLVTTLPRAVAAGAQIFADCKAEQIDFHGSRARRVRARILDRATGQPLGPIVTVEARVVVVAAGGFETPAFLIRQGGATSPRPGAWRNFGSPASTRAATPRAATCSCPINCIPVFWARCFPPSARGIEM